MKIDVSNPLWHVLRKHLEQRLKDLREQNDQTSLSEKQTGELRGRIAEVKDLLALPDEVDLAKIQPPDYDA